MLPYLTEAYLIAAWASFHRHLEVPSFFNITTSPILTSLVLGGLAMIAISFVSADLKGILIV